jgi:L-ribulose-5-phosphate 3-epimerase
MEISIITDEVSHDFETALEIISSWGIKNVEIRGINTERISHLDSFWLQQIPEIAERFGVSIVAIYPGLFKIPFYPGPIAETSKVFSWMHYQEFQARETQIKKVEMHFKQLLPSSIQLARKLGAKIIVIFSFFREEQNKMISEDILEVLRQAAAMAEKEGITLALENEQSCWGDTAENTAKIVKLVGSPALKICWDPANAYMAGENQPFPHGYIAVRDIAVNVHVKDARTDKNGNRAFVSKGEIDWSGHLNALIDDKFDGYLTIETNCKPKLLCARKTLNMIQKVMEERK